MSKRRSKTVVGFQYKFGMHAILALNPLSRVIRIFTDNQDLVTEPLSGGETTISAPTVYAGGEISDGVAGKLRLHLDETPEFDTYLQANYGIDPTLVPRFDAVAHVVFSGTRTVQGGDATNLNSYWEDLGLAPPTTGDPIDAGAGPFYFGNSAFPREFLFIAEGAETSCPYGEFALLPYTHEDWGDVVNDFNPLVIYWEIFIRDNPDEFGSTWETAAETVFNEGIGVYFYSSGGDLEAVEREILRYVNGRSYIDRQTGLKEIQLIRSDYVVEDLPVIGEADLIGEPDLVEPDRSIFQNTIDATFLDRRKKYDTGAFTVQDGAHVAAYGARRGEGDYSWITNRDLATTLALRDVAAMTGGGVTGTIRVSGLRPDLHNGSPFVLDLPTWRISTVVCRILSIVERGLRDNSVDVTFVQDTFGVEVAPVVTDDLPGTETTVALPATHEKAFELPYYVGLLVAGDDFEAQVSAAETFGQLGLVVERPNSRHLAYVIAVDTGGGYVARASASFVTRGTLQGDVTREATTLVVSPFYGIDEESLLLLGDEFVRIDAIDTSGGTTWELTVGRGCIDTAPVAHSAGTDVFRAFDASTDRLAYYDGSTIGVKVMTQTSSSTLSATDADELEVTFASRATRPYPPGQFKVDASYIDDPDGSVIPAEATAELTWVGRNRLLQTDESHIEDHDDGAITPEVGTTYRVEILGYDEDLVSTGAAVTHDVGASTSYTCEASDFHPGTVIADFRVYAVRDSYDSWTAPTIRRLYVGGIEVLESGAPLETEDGGFIELE